VTDRVDDPLVIPPTGNVQALDALVTQLRARHGGVAGVVMYGSCLRSGDYFDGLVDLYLLVDDYRQALGSRLSAVGNRLLPPNVYDGEANYEGHTIRSKYAVVSMDQFARLNSPSRIESYFWGRFSQPVTLVYSRGEREREHILAMLDDARATFLAKVLPALASRGTVEALWQEGLALSYGTELRSEKSGRSVQLVESNIPFYLASTRRWVERFPRHLELSGCDDELCYESHYPDRERRMCRLGWVFRPVLGKLLSLARLLKAFFTFDGGLDYVVWKLERHSGQQIDVPARVRRWPLVFVWGFCWRLYRRGLFK